MQVLGLDSRLKIMAQKWSSMIQFWQNNDVTRSCRWWRDRWPRRRLRQRTRSGDWGSSSLFGKRFGRRTFRSWKCQELRSWQNRHPIIYSKVKITMVCCYVDPDSSPNNDNLTTDTSPSKWFHWTPFFIFLNINLITRTLNFVMAVLAIDHGLFCQRLSLMRQECSRWFRLPSARFLKKGGKWQPHQSRPITQGCLYEPSSH